MKSYFFSAIFILLVSLNASAQKNLISNGNFEDGLNNWGFGNAKVTTLIQKSGEASLALVAYLKGKWEGIEQKIKLPKNAQAISLSGFYKTDEVEQGAKTWNAAVVIVEFSNGDKKLGDAIPLLEKVGTEDWTPFKNNLKVPDSATGFRLLIALSEASGTFFVDDLSAKVISIEEFNKENTPKNN